jgi:hypothetical protein
VAVVPVVGVVRCFINPGFAVAPLERGNAEPDGGVAEHAGVKDAAQLILKSFRIISETDETPGLE